MNSPVKAIKTIPLLVSVFILIFDSISACAPLPPIIITATPAPTATPAINSDQAIEIAIMGCNLGHLRLVGEPQNFRTRLLSLEEADRITSSEGETTNYGIPMDTQVWLVQMDGEFQLMGGPQPVVPMDSQGVVITPTPPQPFWSTCRAVIDASSGKVIYIH